MGEERWASLGMALWGKREKRYRLPVEGSRYCWAHRLREWAAAAAAAAVVVPSGREFDALPGPTQAADRRAGAANHAGGQAGKSGAAVLARPACARLAYPQRLCSVYGGGLAFKRALGRLARQAHRLELCSGLHTVSGSSLRPSSSLGRPTNVDGSLGTSPAPLTGAAQSLGGALAPHALSSVMLAGAAAFRAMDVDMVAAGGEGRGDKQHRREAEPVGPFDSADVGTMAESCRSRLLPSRPALQRTLPSSRAANPAQRCTMSFAQVFLRHHTALATACFVGGASYGLYSTLSHGYAPFGLWGSQGAHIPLAKLTQR